MRCGELERNAWCLAVDNKSVGLRLSQNEELIWCSWLLEVRFGYESHKDIEETLSASLRLAEPF